MVVKAPRFKTLGDILAPLGDVPVGRVRFDPLPGSATVKDVTRIQDRESITCELVEGILLEKTMGWQESSLAVFLGGMIDACIRPKNLGIVLGPDGTIQIEPRLVRIPDVAFFRWDRLPDRRLPTESVPLVVPNLAVEILSKGNTRREMAIKREQYFQAGVELVWEIDPRKRTVVVFTSLTDSVTLRNGDILDGGAVLPGFRLPLKNLFGELDRQG